ncbi:MAG TPA: aldehyde dehydrogenase EutE [Spirochaetota bacterium]|nr:aldehyde dehydrogenase EutE [Spirochaetota bacterium]
MNISEHDIRSMVAEVVRGLGVGTASPASAAPVPAGSPTVSAGAGEGIFPDLESAIQAADKAFREYRETPVSVRKAMIRKIRDISVEYSERLAEMAVNETGFGNLCAKTTKNQLAARKTPGVEDVEAAAYTDEHGLTLIERAPYGVIGSIIPSTNPAATVINNSISMLSGGNTVVFHPHPGAKNVSNFAITLMNKAIREAGGPANCVVGLTTPTMDSASVLMKHKKIAILVVTGGPAVVAAAMNSGKKTIGAGPGNPPCVVDETADIAKAGKDIVNGASFDNNIVCIDEKEILAVASIADRLKQEMVKNGAYELTGAQIEQVTKLVIAKPGGPGDEGAPNKKYVGMDPWRIAADMGLTIPKETKLLLCEVPKEHPLVWTEQLMPVIPLVRCANVDEAIDLAFQCEHGFRHSASMHSHDVTKLSRMARLMNCSIFVKNGPIYSGLGVGGPGFTTLTIASPTGEGLTRARTFTRERRCVLVDSFRIV